MARLGRTALTGTPGTGKSSVARALGGAPEVAEVSELAIEWGAGRKRRSVVDVDLDQLSRRVARLGIREPPRVIVGHLAHLLPVPNAIILRCHPVMLGRRLARARRGSPADRRANVEAEATDVILLEALRDGRRVWEVDTTGRSVRSVAREVRSILDGRRRPVHGRIDWLGDPSVTNALLRRRP